MQEIFLKVIQMSMTASLIALAVTGIRIVFRNAPKWTLCLLWGLVALRLVCPVSIESSLSLVPDRVASGQVISNVGDDYAGAVDIIHENNDGYSSAVEAGRVPIYSSGGYYVVTEHNSVDAPPTIENTVFPVLSWVWATGVMGMLAYSGISYSVLKKRMEEATLLRDNIWQCARVDSPFVLGFLRPRIYLPYRISLSDMENVIAHEQAHIYRKDHWWKPIGFFLLSVHWFNPVMWLSYVLLCRDIEAACDERVIRNMAKEEKQAYSAALFHCSVHRRAIAACPLAFGEVSVKERVKNVMRYKKPAFCVIVISVVVCIAVAVCFLTNPPTPSLEVLPLVHSHSYGVVEVTYESTALVLGEFVSPRFCVTEDMELCVKSDSVSYTEWISLGQLTETELTREHFDDLFYQNECWIKGESASHIRQNAANTWELLMEEAERFFYLIQMKNGELFLVYGYYDYAEKGDLGSDDTAVRWLYRLAVDLNEEYNIIAKSGDNAVPMTIFPAGTAVGNYEKAIQWLTIAPGEDFAPFRTYRNGEELYAIYNVFDAETYEPIPHTIPSGLEPQTYLFQNADPDREYIVVMMLTYESDADIYCFGVRFGEDPKNLAEAPVVMVPTDSALDGIFDRYLYLTIDGEKYRYERQETTPGGIQAGPEVATVYEDSGVGDRYYYTVFSVENCIDNSMFLVHSEDMDMMWLYQYSPSKASNGNALQNAKDAGYVVMEDGDVTHGQDIWLDFYEKTRQGKTASVRVAHYYTLDPNNCSDQFYEAYKEDYPSLYLHELTYDGETYTIRWNEHGTEYVRTYEYLMNYSFEGYWTAGTDTIRFVLTHDDSVTWAQIVSGCFSSQMGAYIDHYTVYTDTSE